MMRSAYCITLSKFCEDLASTAEQAYGAAVMYPAVASKYTLQAHGQKFDKLMPPRSTLAALLGQQTAHVLVMTMSKARWLLFLAAKQQLLHVPQHPTCVYVVG